MTQELDFANNLIDFIHASPSPFHAVSNVKQTLLSNGFAELQPLERWELSKGGKYFMTRNDSAIVAFVVGQGQLEREGFRLIGAHTDSPTFRIKPAPEMVAEKIYLKLNVETYDGPILNTWLDRPLSLAGRVSLKSRDPLHPIARLVQMDKPIVTIPNQSLHMNRKVNEGIELNKQADMLPLAACVGEGFAKEGFLVGLLAGALGVDAGDLVDFDLVLSDYERGRVIGVNDEFISCTRLDDLAMVHAGLHALLRARPVGATQVLACYDNEECGSKTKQGAASPMLVTLLERIVLALGHRDREDFFRAIGHSILVSADMGHGVHPNATDKHDPSNRPVLNGGPMIKVAANQNFTTDSDTGTVFALLCQRAGIPFQRFVSRSDLQGGSTIGPLSAAYLDIRSLDVGNPLLAAHSIRELGGVLDHAYMARALEEFYSA